MKLAKPIISSLSSATKIVVLLNVSLNVAHYKAANNSFIVDAA